MTALVPVGADLLWVEDTGGDGEPLVLLHPGITDSRIWDRLAPLLGDRRVVRFDRRGFGGSPPATEEYSALDDLVAVLDDRGIERAHLIGNSMGGETSLALAVTAPERVASMTLLCPGINGYDWPETDEDPDLEAAWAACKENEDLPGLAALQVRYWMACGSDEFLADQVLRTTILDASPAAALEQPNPEQWSRLDTLRIPTSVIAAEQDPLDSLLASVDLAERIPDAELVRLDVDHVPQYRDPDAVADVVLRTVGRAT